MCSRSRPRCGLFVSGYYVLVHYLVVRCIVMELHHTIDMPQQRCPVRRWVEPDGFNRYREHANVLSATISSISDSLSSANATYWLLPGSGLIQSNPSSTKFRFTEWHRGTTIGVLQTEMMRVLLAVSSLDDTSRIRHRILAVETFSGLRLFPVNGVADPRLDYKEPYVDIMFFTLERERLVNFCCDCERVTISACTKKTCGCMICAYDVNSIFPVGNIPVEGVQHPLPGPKDVASVKLSATLPGVHPLFLQ
jgi:hypothetical protein